MTDINNPKDELTNAGLRVVAFSGNARSNFLEALDLAKDGKFEEADQYIKMGLENLELAGQAQKISLLMKQKEIAKALIS